MVATGVLAYFGAGTILFFFWAYGIYAFARDLRHKFLPLARQYLRGRRERKRAEERERERTEREEQLY
ncbi:hypothetical protein VB773_11435 [Haloarculaceae archaeon H-GB2-1]|nr:hypothetical protein [Haloarculaceae archaeon H-GB1-1]MEA5386588.1 hypothetical protein [Haloarculaceae archaeon H-GB11]MEA5408107.1 hypothetical protein [Haloarculaceae archaeon H-GB2-1]